MCGHLCVGFFLQLCPTDVVNGAEKCPLLNLIQERCRLLFKMNRNVIEHMERSSDTQDHAYLLVFDSVIGLLDECVGGMVSMQLCNFNKHVLPVGECAVC